LTTQAVPGGGRPPGIAVCYAVPEERRYFGSLATELAIVRDGSAIRVGPAPGGLVSDDALACSLRIGVGPRSAMQNTLQLLESCESVHTLLIVGFAGGLAAGLKPGTVVVSDKVFETGSHHEFLADTALRDLARKISPSGVPVAHGRIVSTDSVLVSAAEKRDLAAATDGIAVDMESAGAVRAARMRSVRWIAVRAITDGVEDDLPFDFNAPIFKAPGDPDGGVNRSRVVSEALLHPWKIPALIRLGARSSRAARNHSAYLVPLVRRLNEIGPP
jgi:adenosylhomocysteine nucleosidase